MSKVVLFLALAFVACQYVLAKGPITMAIMGDSGTTGALQGGMEADLKSIGKNLLNIFKVKQRRAADYPNAKFFQISDPVTPLNRVFFSKEDYAREQGKGKLMLQLAKVGTNKLDVPEYTWGYMLGRWMNVEPKNIMLVGENGARVNKIGMQLERIGKNLPNYVFLQFSANDFCSLEWFQKTPAQLKEKYVAVLRRELKKVFTDYKPHAEGTKFVVIEPYNVTSVLTEPTLLAQTVKFQGGHQATCKEFHDGNAAKGFLGEVLYAKLSGMCQVVFSTKTTETAKINRLNELQNTIIESWQQIVKEMSAQRMPGYSWEFVGGLFRDPGFATGDLTGDCFHPSVSAHAKLADRIIKTYFNGRRP